MIDVLIVVFYGSLVGYFLGYISQFVEIPGEKFLTGLVSSTAVLIVFAVNKRLLKQL